MEGTQVCQKLRESKERPYVYVLLLTGRSQKEDLLAGLESGADDYLTKPFDAQELRARLHVGQRILDLQDKLIAAGEELLFRATHDSLTGVANRGVILDTLRRERARQAREGGSFAIVLADLDHFKYVNDTYGHQAGDDVLRATTQRMMGCVRPYDCRRALWRRGISDRRALLGRHGRSGSFRTNPPRDRRGARGRGLRPDRDHGELRHGRQHCGTSAGSARNAAAGGRRAVPRKRSWTKPLRAGRPAGLDDHLAGPCGRRSAQDRAWQINNFFIGRGDFGKWKFAREHTARRTASSWLMMAGRWPG